MSQSKKDAETLYRSRAAHYDASNGGWHAVLGRDFVQWTAPARGSAILDLACGTGLVTTPMAKAVGCDGIEVGVDATAAMLDIARGKEIPEGAAQVEFVEADICDRDEISGIETVRSVVERRGGFDVIACCSALVLLRDLARVVRGWVGLLREGGRLIVDVPTEQRTVQYLFTSALHAELGMAVSYNRDWVKGMENLESVFEEAGLVVERSWKTKSYLPERWYEDEESVRDEVFDRQTGDTYLDYAKKGRLEDARVAWREVWKLGVDRETGMLYEGHPLYVSIGRKP